MRVFAFITRHASRLMLCAVIAALYGLTRVPEPSASERAEIAARFAFRPHDLPLVEEGRRSVRQVHPSLSHISAWISSVGAAVTLADLDGDALPNDVVHVDVTTDDVIVAPVPGTGERFDPFTLVPPSLGPDDAIVAPMGTIVTDLDENGLADVLVYYWGRPPVGFLRVDRSLRESSFAAVAIASDERWYTNAATVADVDGDGHLDIVVGNYFQDGSRILDPVAGGTESMQHSMTRAYNGGRNRVLLWTGASSGPDPGVTFRDVPDVFETDVQRAWTLAVGATDLDGDLLPELYFANDFGPDRLLHNRSTPGEVRLELVEGRRTLTTPSSKVLGRDSFKGMGVDFGDLDHDGHLDIYVSNIAAEFALEESHYAFISTGELDRFREGVAPFVDRSERLGLSRSSWGWDSRLCDLDNDGVLEALQATGFVKGESNRWPELQELAISNDELLTHPASWPRFEPGVDLSGHAHNPFFVRSPGGRYVDIAPELGLDAPAVTRGIATADVDGDGDLDFAIANQWERSRFFENVSPGVGAFLVLELLLPLDRALDRVESVGRLGYPGLTRAAVGARVRVRLPDGAVRVGFVDGGNGHSGVRSRNVHLGLGDVHESVAVELEWRDAGGRIREHEMELLPGRHTLVLASSGGRNPS